MEQMKQETCNSLWLCFEAIHVECEPMIILTSNRLILNAFSAHPHETHLPLVQAYQKHLSKFNFWSVHDASNGKLQTELSLKPS